MAELSDRRRPADRGWQARHDGAGTAADGKPNFNGMWGWDTPAKCGAHCNDLQISREFLNIAASEARCRTSQVLRTS